MSAYAREQAERAERIRALKEANRTIEEIAEAMGMETCSIKSHLRKLGLSGTGPRKMRPEYFEVLRRVALGENAPQITAGMRCADLGRTSKRLRDLQARGFVDCVDHGHAKAKTWTITDAGRAALAEYRRQP